MKKKCCESRPRCKNCPKRRHKKTKADHGGKRCGQPEITAKFAIR